MNISFLSLGRDSGNAERWNQDSGSNNNYNSFRNNNRGNNMNMNMNMSNRNTMSNSSMQAPCPQIFDEKPYKSVLNGGILQGYASAKEIRARYPNGNDCEIVVLDKNLV